MRMNYDACSTDEDTIHNYLSEHFSEGRLISFVFNGTGMYNNILTAYDTGTGNRTFIRGLHLTQKYSLSASN